MQKISRPYRLGLFLALTLLQVVLLNACSFVVMEQAKGQSSQATAQQSQIRLTSATRNERLIHICVELQNQMTGKTESYTLQLPHWAAMEQDDLEPQDDTLHFTAYDYSEGCQPLELEMPTLSFGKGEKVELRYRVPEVVYLYQDEQSWALGLLAQQEGSDDVYNVSLDLSRLPVMNYYHDKKPYLLVLLPVTVPLDMSLIVVGGGVFLVGVTVAYPFIVISEM